MHPDKLGFDHCDSNTILHSKETQTTESSIAKASSKNSSVKSSIRSLPPRPPLPRDINKSDKGSISVFEFCQVLQDPESPKSITIVKETVSEEVHNHSDKISSEDAISNRYKYCKEVIKPYLKSHSDECVDSDEELIKDALDSISTDFPDYQPCFEDTTDNEKKVISDTYSVLKADTGTSFTSKYSKSTMESKSKECVKDKSSTESKKSKGCVKDKSSSSSLSKPKCPPPIDSCKELIPSSTKKSGETSRTKIENSCPSKEGSDHCGISMNKSETKSEDKALHEVKPKESDQSSASIQTKPKFKSMIEAHSETMVTLKCAMEDFIGKVYNKTKDAVTLITTESAKQLEKIKKTESCNTETATSKKNNESKSSETLTSFNFFRKTDNQKEKKDQSTHNKSESGNTTDVFGKISGKVESVISVLNEHMPSLPNLPEVLKPSNFDTSSEYDVPKPLKSKPKDVSNVIVDNNSVTSSVFTAIKSRIVSMFYDSDSNINTNQKAPSNPSPSSSDESIDDITGRYNN